MDRRPARPDPAAAGIGDDEDLPRPMNESEGLPEAYLVLIGVRLSGVRGGDD